MALGTKSLPFLGLSGRRKRFNPALCFVAQPELFAAFSSGSFEPFSHVVRSALRGGATSIQLRSKNSSTRQFIEAARVVRQLIDEELPFARTVPLIINDRIDVSLAVNADGVHLGQDDMPLSLARRLLPRDKIVGVTVRNPKQARQALIDGADYLGTDAIFATTTKPESNPLGLDKFREICAATSLPVLGIGGPPARPSALFAFARLLSLFYGAITKINDIPCVIIGITTNNAAQVVRAGASGIAVVSAIASSPEPQMVTESLLNSVSSTLPVFSSNNNEWARRVADRWMRLRSARPLVQHLTNFVVMNSTGTQFKTTFIS